MVKQPIKNQYPGINAHLNSYLQDEPGGWQSFHSEHIIDLLRGIRVGLPAGYYARSEKTLQISETIPPADIGSRKSTTPDVMVYRLSSTPISSGSAPALTATPPARTIPIKELLSAEDFLTGIVIYQAGEDSSLGKPVTRVEFLSPANKPGGSHFSNYVVKRAEALRSGLRLVEIDYLHWRPPVAVGLPSYPDGEAGAFPYLVLVSDPRPVIESGFTNVYEIGVDDPLPVITIPLAGTDTMTLDLGVVYNQTFDSSDFFYVVVDYSQEPVHFERYTEADRARIKARMKIINTQLKQG